MRASDEEQFRDFATAVMPRLRRVAIGVCRDPHGADDLVQSTMEKVYIAWPRVSRADSPYAYARTMLVRTLIAQRRRAWWTREVSTDGGG